MQQGTPLQRGGSRRDNVRRMACALASSSRGLMIASNDLPLFGIAWSPLSACPATVISAPYQCWDGALPSSSSPHVQSRDELPRAMGSTRGCISAPPPHVSAGRHVPVVRPRLHVPCRKEGRRACRRRLYVPPLCSSSRVAWVGLAPRRAKTLILSRVLQCIYPLFDYITSRLFDRCHLFRFHCSSSCIRKAL